MAKLVFDSNFYLNRLSNYFLFFKEKLKIVTLYEAFSQFFLGIFGFSLAFYPEVCGLVLFLFGIFKIYSKKVLIQIKPAFFVILIGILIFFPRHEMQEIGIYLIYTFYYIVLFIALKLLPKDNSAIFITSLTVGLGFLFVATIVISSLPKSYSWDVGEVENRVTFKEESGIDIFTPISDENAWSSKPIDQWGPGRIEIEFITRSRIKNRINFFIIQKSLPESRADKICIVNNDWSNCKIEVNLVERAPALVGVGGFGSWKKKDSVIEVKSINIKNLTPVSLLEVLKTLPRVTSWFPNANLFGGHVCLIAMIIISQINKANINIIIYLTSSAAILFSGSRNAFYVFSIGFFTWLFHQKSRSKYFYASFLCLCLISINYFPSIRASDILVNDGAFYQRAMIYRKAIANFIYSPILGIGKEKAVILTDKITKKRTNYAHYHSLLFQTLSETGLFGVFLLGLGCMFIYFKQRHSLSFNLVIFTYISLNSLDYFVNYASFSIIFLFCLSQFDRFKVSNPDP